MADETLADHVPTDGWLGAWCKEMSSVIASPPEFILAAGLGALSATVGRQLWFPLGRRRWFPHLWLMLLAPAGIRKSIAVNQTVKAVRHARGKEGLLPNRWSPESFWDGLETSPDGLWNVGEISGFLGSARKDYMSGARADLCDVWDSQDIYRRTRTKTNEVAEPAPTALATGRVDDFMSAAGLADFRSGFFSRWLIVTTKVTGKEFYRGMIESDSIDEQSDSRFQDLYGMGMELRAGKPRKAAFTHDAMLLWESYDKRWQFEEHIDELSGFARRRGIQAAKLAVLHALSSTFDPRLTVEPNSVAWGIACSECCFDQVRTMQMDEIGMSQRAQERDRIWRKVVDLIQRKGTDGAIGVREVYTRLWRDFDDASRARKQVEMWEKAGKIQMGWLKSDRGPAAEAVRLLTGPPPENWWDTNPMKVRSATQAEEGEPAHNSPTNPLTNGGNPLTDSVDSEVSE